MNPKERRNLGAHYTSEKNILKLIKPLFLDELWEEFEILKDNRNRLIEFHRKLSKLTFLDPACGCGNFLIITYRELRLLEIEVIKKLHGNQQVTSIDVLVNVSVNQFYGIEYEEFPARIAEVAMWLIDHQMNMMVGNEFGQYFVRLPLRQAATIVNGNALLIDWKDILQHQYSDIEAGETTLVLNEPVSEYTTINVKTKKLTIVDQRVLLSMKDTVAGAFDYIIGNPPFKGSAYQNQEQKSDMAHVFAGLKNYGMLDYVAAWYKKAAEYIMNTNAKVAFVSTNSIVQGEQPGILWTILFSLYKIKIHFAHRTFVWNNEAKGNAAVHVVIIGFANFNATTKVIYDYQGNSNEPFETKVKNINPYLVEGRDIVLNSIPNSICSAPRMQSGSAARDGGFLILTDDEKQELERRNPSVRIFLRRFISGDDFINNVKRWCIWLKEANPKDFRKVPEFQERFQAVRAFREASTRIGTKRMADLPYLFAEERQPENDFLLIPKVSSETRKYIPIAYLTKDHIVSDKTFVIPNTTLYHFGVITSQMHMTWMRATCGRMKSDYSYSNTIVYNNFPWPENQCRSQIEVIEEAVQEVLNQRANYDGSTLADLYNRNTMPASLVKAHNKLDRAVDQAYRSQPFTSEANRLEFLFSLYEKYTADLFTTKNQEKPRRK